MDSQNPMVHIPICFHGLIRKQVLRDAILAIPELIPARQNNCHKRLHEHKLSMFYEEVLSKKRNHLNIGVYVLKISPLWKFPLNDFLCALGKSYMQMFCKELSTDVCVGAPESSKYLCGMQWLKIFKYIFISNSSLCNKILKHILALGQGDRDPEG